MCTHVRRAEGHIRSARSAAGRLWWRTSFICEVNVARRCWLLIYPIAESQLHDSSKRRCNVCVLLCRCLQVWHVMVTLTPRFGIPLTHHPFVCWLITLISKKHERKSGRIVWGCLHSTCQLSQFITTGAIYDMQRSSKPTCMRTTIVSGLHLRQELCFPVFQMLKCLDLGDVMD